MSLTYEKYLHLNELLNQQCLLSKPPEHDELLFITVHQVYELWFKQIKHELFRVQRGLRNDNIGWVNDGFKRIITILKTLVSQLDIMETMTPVSFNSFREILETASGLQSVQFREIEFILGKRDAKIIERFVDNPNAQKRLKDILKQTSLWQDFIGFLSHEGYNIPEDRLQLDTHLPTEASTVVQKILIDIYQSQSPLSALCERFVDLDEGFQEWRYRHVKMVQRTIGSKTGTGALGSDYLMTTLNIPLFPDLWTIRVNL